MTEENQPIEKFYLVRVDKVVIGEAPPSEDEEHVPGKLVIAARMIGPDADNTEKLKADVLAAIRKGYDGALSEMNVIEVSKSTYETQRLLGKNSKYVRKGE